jgi:hypothetical protein
MIFLGGGGAAFARMSLLVVGRRSGCQRRLGGRGGAVHWWGAHRHRGGLEQWPDKAVVDEVAIEEEVDDIGFRDGLRGGATA